MKQQRPRGGGQQMMQLQQLVRAGRVGCRQAQVVQGQAMGTACLVLEEPEALGARAAQVDHRPEPLGRMARQPGGRGLVRPPDAGGDLLQIGPPGAQEGVVGKLEMPAGRAPRRGGRDVGAVAPGQVVLPGLQAGVNLADHAQHARWGSARGLSGKGAARQERPPSRAPAGGVAGLPQIRALCGVVTVLCMPAGGRGFRSGPSGAMLERGQRRWTAWTVRQAGAGARWWESSATAIC